MRSTLIRWLKANVPQTTRDDGFQSLLDGIRPLALTSNEERSVIFVSQRNSSTILKVTVTCTGACLCGNAEPFVTLPGMACGTGLGYSEETRDLYVADSQDEGGIYMVDTSMEAGRPSYVKILHNNPVDCGRVYDLVVNSSGELFFTDVDRRQIGKLVNGNTVEHVAGSGRDEPRDGCQQTVSFVQPTGLCSEGDSLYVTDTGAGALKLITPTKPMAMFMESVSALYWSHGAILLCNQLTAASPP